MKQGISENLKIVTKKVKLLGWKGIEATQEISKSPNTKVVVIGNSDGELPIILGGDNN